MQFGLKEYLLTKKELENKLAAHRHELRKMGVVSLAVFGSVARDESNQQSDIDLLVDFDREVGLFYLFEIQHKLEDIIGVTEKTDAADIKILHFSHRHTDIRRQ